MATPATGETAAIMARIDALEDEAARLRETVTADDAEHQARRRVSSTATAPDGTPAGPLEPTGAGLAEAARRFGVQA
jgi:hypothetical protein